MNMKKLFLLVSTLLLATTSSVLTEPLLSDQFGNELDIGKVLASPSVLLLHSDERDAAEQLKYLSQLVGPGVQIVAVADLSALPFFVPKKAVTESLKKDEPGLPIMLDWKGEIKKSQKLKDGNIARVYKSGRGGTEYRVEKKSGKLESGAIAALKGELATAP